MAQHLKKKIWSELSDAWSCIVLESVHMVTISVIIGLFLFHTIYLLIRMEIRIRLRR